ncbi:YfiR family protein [Pseudodesulfovibrio thermohalotolerans]|uniref:YfiR family protein n=1 Tax=Pseudodesulfovibrio thermohalotolerans TaxID=2880651 RepID=UPI002442DC2E|nr:YfiR family protein [Pseudodesulfovibrio thermohalotolerans]WFS63302.1 YfiR family protein [Pseudodesulfovibrio thermohalotolerans]
MGVLRPIFLSVLVWAFFVSPYQASGGTRLTAEPDQLRALYVQRLVKYVTWPRGAGPAPGEPFVVAATDPARLRPYFPDSDAVGDGPRFRLVQWPAECHVLFLAGASRREGAAIIKRVVDLPVLTITQDPEGPEQGAIINFYMQGGRLKLEVNPDAAGRAGLAVSSRLMQLARIHRGGADE